MQGTSIDYKKKDKDTNKQICDVLGCSEDATEEITVNAGKFGTILLAVCTNCIGKFAVS